jgi:hypothetical protein
MCSNRESRFLSATEWLAATTCLRDGNMEKLASFTDSALIYCRKCKALYCWEQCWDPKKIVFDGSFCDYAVGNCPKGYQAAIDD